MQDVHQADRSSKGEGRRGGQGALTACGAVAIGVSLLGGVAGCSEPQQSVRRYQPAPTSRPSGQAQTFTETPTTENYEERAEAIRRVCNRKASTDLGRCWSDEAGRKQDPKFEARINLTITVSPEGAATEVKVLNPSSENRTLEQCVIDSAKSWTYPSGQTEVPVQCGFYLRPGV
ncbi:MAG: AgmX/PglI C-terminal domain-containing protein [Polyangia bacterium]